MGVKNNKIKSKKQVNKTTNKSLEESKRIQSILKKKEKDFKKALRESILNDIEENKEDEKLEINDISMLYSNKVNMLEKRKNAEIADEKRRNDMYKAINRLTCNDSYIDYEPEI